jgi:hypothetical protein
LDARIQDGGWRIVRGQTPEVCLWKFHVEGCELGGVGTLGHPTSVRNCTGRAD